MLNCGLENLNDVVFVKISLKSVFLSVVLCSKNNNAKITRYPNLMKYNDTINSVSLAQNMYYHYMVLHKLVCDAWSVWLKQVNGICV